MVPSVERQLVYTMIITNNKTPFHLWRTKYFEHDSSKLHKLHIHMMSLSLFTIYTNDFLYLDNLYTWIWVSVSTKDQIIKLLQHVTLNFCKRSTILMTNLLAYIRIIYLIIYHQYHQLNYHKSMQNSNFLEFCQL